MASGLATIVAALQALLAHRRLWHINNVAMAALDKLQRDLDYRHTDPSPIQKPEIDEFYDRYDRVIEEADQAWIQTYAVR